MKVEIRIAPDDAGQRVDRYLRRYLAALSLARIQSLLRRKEVKVNRKPVKGNHLLASGDHLEVYGLTPEQGESVHGPQGHAPGGAAGWGPPPESVPAFPILFEDESLLVVDKPAGLAVHPGTGITPGRSLIELAQAYLGRSRDTFFQPALVHRLDKETSGVLLIAKTGGALRALTAALRAGQLRKAYLALLVGRPPQERGTLRDALERIDTRQGGAKSLVQDEGKEAVTHYEVLQTQGGFTLVRAIIETGRMHQIRAQFSHAGCPLAGDRRYASPEANALAKEKLGLRRLFLHAESLTWKDGRSSQVFSAPLPEALQTALGRAGLRI